MHNDNSPLLLLHEPKDSNQRSRGKEGLEEGLARGLGSLGLLVALLRNALLLDWRMKKVSIRGRMISFRVRTELLPAEGLRVGVEAEEDTLVGQRVLVLRPGALLDLSVGGTDNRLDLVAVDETGDIRVADLRGGEAESGCH